jgi:phosphatidylserine/phosphatidylglycerophosphate/cardiolipin synthase-like enzyme
MELVDSGLIRRIRVSIRSGFLISIFFLSACAGSPSRTAGPPNWSVYFSPKGGCTEAIVSAIAGAKRTVFVQAYTFTSAPIAKALVEAHKRGVDVQVILDKSNLHGKYSSTDLLIHAGIPTRIDAIAAIAHNKVIVIDNETVVTGSFNFTNAAEEHNAENLLVIHDATLAARYVANWRVRERRSELYTHLRTKY